MTLRKMESLTQGQLRHIAVYNPESGVFRWKRRPREDFNSEDAWKWWNKCRADKTAGNYVTGGYLAVTINNRRYLMHRLAWLYVHGVYPAQIDHINGRPRDNRIINLREASQAQNMQNRSLHCKSKTGIFGVRWVSSRNGKNWLVSIGGEKTIRYFSDFFEACCARKSAEVRLGYHPNHGRPSMRRHNCSRIASNV